MNLQEQEQFYQMMTRLRANSRAASLSTRKDDVLITEIVDGLIVSKPAKKVQEITESKAITTNEAKV